MGWKLAIATFPLKGRSLGEGVSAFYGAKRALAPCAETVELVIYPKNEKNAYACEQDGRAWIFDWPYVSRVFEDGYHGSENASFYLLMSTVNLYGFALYENGEALRRRTGSSDDGIIIDDGPLIPAERNALSVLGGEAGGHAGLEAWMNAEQTFEGPDFEETHDSLGEEIVFAVMEAQTGLRFDQATEKSDDFFSRKTVFSVKKPKTFGIF